MGQPWCPISPKPLGTKSYQVRLQYKDIRKTHVLSLENHVTKLEAPPGAFFLYRRLPNQAGRGADRDCPPMATRREPRDGYTKAILRAHGFSMDMMVELVKTGLATTKRERMIADGRQTDVVRVRITEAGRQALAKMSKRV
jgi:hypothetical protein